MNKHDLPTLIQKAAYCALMQSTTLLLEWLPEGTARGSEWIARNIVRGDRNPGSFSISMDTGRWNDFADPDAHGGDLVSLLAYLRQCNQLAAAKEIDARLALGLFSENKGRSSAPIAISDAQLIEKQLQRDKEIYERREQAAKKALSIWQRAKPADTSHPYLRKKHVMPFNLRQTKDGNLLVPLGFNDKLANLQVISPTCEKRFLSGGQVKGCYCPIGSMKPQGRVYICEGWATGASVHISTGMPVICAMTAANLEPAALHIREQLGATAEIIIAGDDDRQTEGNPGKTYAIRAALRVNAKVVFPVWPLDAPKDLTDFNDLHVWYTQQAERGCAHE